MKHIYIVAAFLFMAVSTLSHAQDLSKTERNAKIIDAVKTLNETSSESLAETQQKILASFDDPKELVRFMIVCKYLAWPQEAGEQSADSKFASMDFYKRLRELKAHKSFLPALVFIDNNMKLDAGESTTFNEFLLSVKDNPDVARQFLRKIVSASRGK